MFKNAACLISVLMSFSSFLFGFDKDRLGEHLKKALNEDERIVIKVGEPKESDLGDLLEVPITRGSGAQAQEQTVYITKDETKYFCGVVFDLTVDPDQERADKINVSDSYSKGKRSAPVTLVEFSDLQCGYCRKAHLALEKELYKEYSKKEVRLVFKHFPLGGHKWAEPAAVAAQCAGEQGEDKFWGMIDLVFENSSSINPANGRKKTLFYGRELGLNTVRLKKCMDGKEALGKVNKDKSEGLSVGVRSTPTFFVNGRMLRGFRDFKPFKPLIDRKLKDAKK